MTKEEGKKKKEGKSSHAVIKTGDYYNQARELYPNEPVKHAALKMAADDNKGKVVAVNYEQSSGQYLLLVEV